MGTSLANHRTHHVSISNGTIDPVWDHFVEQAPGGHHAQTSLWGKLKSSLGSKSARVTISGEDGETIAGAQLLMRSLPLGATVAYIPKGPVLAPEVADDPEVLQLVIDEIHQIARSEGVQCLIIQPPDNGDQIADKLSEWNFELNSFQMLPTATVQIDLSQELDTIMSRAKAETRRMIRRGLREGLTFREGGRDDIPTFYRLFLNTAERQGFPPFPEEYFTQMWDLFHDQGQIKLFFCEKDGEPISTRLVLPFGDTVLGKNTGWSGEHKRLNPNQVLEWKIIEWAKDRGYRYYDFDGMDHKSAREILSGERNPDPAIDGAAYYKLSFGGDIKIFPLAYSHVYNPVLRTGYNLVAQRVMTHPRFVRSLERLRAG